ncbi:radical SAM protein [Reichenbachiella carrageenanivorans]|uniref:Radical SAM protein n=1 Tax=Reichenbachiella carrageenanivorans TaxID=2979869 RepID=A0ABY6D1H7_9BACT|nr:radical SAM protein [Reichenbachiella carrageenanivorans]UXX78933.1 radical SAM protein [Reichenbachiella carrageenanivorans]
MAQSIHTLLLTPPFTQLNTPYPATAYLKGFLNTIDAPASQADLGIEVILALFTRKGIQRLFQKINEGRFQLGANENRMVSLQETYLSTIEPVIAFLQNKNPTLAYSISERDYLPEASRFDQIDDLEWAFGNLGIQDKARHLATLYLEDLADLIKNTIDPFFGFSRYAERLSLSAESFDPLYESLNAAPSFIDEILFDCLAQKLTTVQPGLVCLSVPFPGNLYGALRCGQYLKQHHPGIKIAMGGGYPNTELRSLKDSRLFEFIDYITLDDGERPIQLLLDHLSRQIGQTKLKRTLLLLDGHVTYVNGASQPDVTFSQTGTPDYAGMALDQYLSVIEITNPMHRLWSDGRWNKLTMAHGCYWKKCTFCDISLDYIKNYEPVSAAIICDRMEAQIQQTGETGFHFVDEAAPPALMREVAIEILRRQLKVSWWTNIRFEKRFTPDLCRLLKASGCIAVSGGLEVASDRLLEKIQKGVTVAQVAQVTDNFTASGIMVHAYLMYGFPTQTEQETIDSLEMVRQLFELGVIQSAFWHQFAMTAHSPVGMTPEAFGAKALIAAGDFAHNDIPHEDLEGADHALFSEGLRKSLFNYMHGACLDFPLQEWFDFEIPETTISPFEIEMAIQNNPGTPISNSSKLVWLHANPQISFYSKKQKGKTQTRCKFVIHTHQSTEEAIFNQAQGQSLKVTFEKLTVKRGTPITLAEFKTIYEQEGSESFDKLTKSQGWQTLRKVGLLMV